MTYFSFLADVRTVKHRFSQIKTLPDLVQRKSAI